MSGVSFLPSADEGHIYEAAPYEDCDKDIYEEYMEVLPKNIDWGKLQENQDNTTGMQELACTGDKCEI